MFAALSVCLLSAGAGACFRQKDRAANASPHSRTDRITERLFRVRTQAHLRGRNNPSSRMTGTRHHSLGLSRLVRHGIVLPDRKRIDCDSPQGATATLQAHCSQTQPPPRGDQSDRNVAHAILPSASASS